MLLTLRNLSCSKAAGQPDGVQGNMATEAFGSQQVSRIDVPRSSARRIGDLCGIRNTLEWVRRSMRLVKLAEHVAGALS